MTLVWDVTWPTQNHLLVMLKLADHANDDGGKVWPAVATIARQAQCSERTVQNVLKALRDCGLATVERSGGGSMPTVYAINTDLLRALAGFTLDGSADRIDIPEELCTQVVPNSPERGATVAPLDVAPVQPATRGGAKHRGGGAKLLHPNHHTNHQENLHLAKDSNFDLKVKGGASSVHLVRISHPDQVAAWRRYALHRGGLAMRTIVRMIDTHACVSVPSQWPPDVDLSKISKRTTGDAA